MILVDTNVLLHAVNRDSPDCAAARGALETLTNGHRTWALSWTIAYEFLRVATHPRVFPRPLDIADAWEFLHGLISRPTCLLLMETGQHQEIFGRCLGECPRLRGNILHDLHTAILMREHGIHAILTQDLDFQAFPWVRRLTLDADVAMLG
jgi:toxin-antitoxin system PIN domain toxin